MKYQVVSINDRGEVYSITPPEDKELAEDSLDKLRMYMPDDEHKLVQKNSDYKKEYEL